jgi:DNA-binding CsgD family transcriptional regulator
MALEVPPSNDSPRSAEAMELRRERAVIADEFRGVSGDLGAIWRSLADGRVKVADTFSRRGRSYLVLAKVSPDDSSRVLPPPLRSTFEAVVHSGALKVVASEKGCTVSTIAMRAKQALTFIGLPCPFSRAPALLILAVHASRGTNVLAPARVSEIVTAERSLEVVSIEELGLAVASRLSPGENAVVREWLDGRSHAEVAAGRHTSARTVANQISTASRKLGTSGRLDLIARLAVADSAAHGLRISA